MDNFIALYLSMFILRVLPLNNNNMNKELQQSTWKNNKLEEELKRIEKLEDFYVRGVLVYLLSGAFWIVLSLITWEIIN